ncbi:hypothetical protein C8F04DRAFT_1219080 [Mycena alexandri]|uniref:WW domain-containing protein n=1 Tax=Mycena alexandri TaxID=1745969 RepID=A0AAD6XEJ4_9AGAR|nr:hypothetical protein C8F04DRAFT_1219080 [Mycena alexandri]
MERPLPYGWISQVDQNSGHKFYVDTKATPPRSIWVHPLEDEQYLREHPEAREKAGLAADEKQPQYSAPTTPAVGSPAASSSQRGSYAAPAGSKPEKRGLFGKLKDATVGTKEEREQEKRHKAEQKRQMLELRERRHQEMLAQQAAMYQQQQQQQEMYARQNPQYQQQYAPQYGYAPQQQQRSGFGGGGMAMPLLGGLAGGLLLGEVLGGDGFGGDDGGGGDFGGGDGGGGGDF